MGPQLPAILSHREHFVGYPSNHEDYFDDISIGLCSGGSASVTDQLCCTPICRCICPRSHLRTKHHPRHRPSTCSSLHTNCHPACCCTCRPCQSVPFPR